ncbi:hypothetical protein ACH347_26635 [Saccharopolyspora sp. 5N102]|uniref:hypothetical protein n=1 Tax=Saccharopolyspora sp. 5N102 TaxID=3375155 RepID=UPI00378BDCB8
MRAYVKGRTQHGCPSPDLYLLGLVVTFGIRTWLQVRRTGDSGFRRPAARIGSATWWGTVLFAAALVLGTAAPALAVAGILEPLTILRDPVIELLGLVVAVAGFLGVIAAQTGMGSSWRVGVDDTERTALVTSGAFSLVRKSTPRRRSPGSVNGESWAGSCCVTDVYPQSGRRPKTGHYALPTASSRSTPMVAG